MGENVRKVEERKRGLKEVMKKKNDEMENVMDGNEKKIEKREDEIR